jgi:hypothetical protein
MNIQKKQFRYRVSYTVLKKAKKNVLNKLNFLFKFQIEF